MENFRRAGAFVILLMIASVVCGQPKPIWPIDRVMLDKQLVDGWDRDAYIKDGSGERLMLYGTYLFAALDMTDGGFAAVFLTLDWDNRVFKEGTIFVNFWYNPDRIFIPEQRVLLWLEHTGTGKDFIGDKVPRFCGRACLASGLYYGPYYGRLRPVDPQRSTPDWKKLDHLF